MSWLIYQASIDSVFQCVGRKESKMTIDKSCNGHTTRHDFKQKIDPEEDEKLCGIGRFRPDFLQVLMP